MGLEVLALAGLGAWMLRKKRDRAQPLLRAGYSFFALLLASTLLRAASSTAVTVFVLPHYPPLLAGWALMTAGIPGRLLEALAFLILIAALMDHRNQSGIPQGPGEDRSGGRAFPKWAGAVLLAYGVLLAGISVQQYRWGAAAQIRMEEEMRPSPAVEAIREGASEQKETGEFPPPSSGGAFTSAERP